nr:sugar transferase [Rhodanobacter sp. MP7CTX1]
MAPAKSRSRDIERDAGGDAVLKGEMSFIGPGAATADLGEKIRDYSLRHCLRPGFADWAQLRYPCGTSKADVTEKLKYDTSRTTVCCLICLICLIC